MTEIHYGVECIYRVVVEKQVSPLGIENLTRIDSPYYDYWFLAESPAEAHQMATSRFRLDGEPYNKIVSTHICELSTNFIYGHYD